MLRKVTVLGCGTSTGVPVIACQCPVCRSSAPRNKRLRSSVLLTSDRANIVIDTTPEFRLQMLTAKVTKLAAVLYTHIHADHCHGFDDLRMFAFADDHPSIVCYIDGCYLDEFKAKFPYAFKTTSYLGTVPEISLLAIPASNSLQIADLDFETVQLAHGEVVSTAFRTGSFAYVTDFKGFPSALIDRWRGKITTLIISGVHFREHKSHSSIPESLAIATELAVQRCYITHLSHEVDYYRHSDRLPAGIELAYDGLVVEFT